MSKLLEQHGEATDANTGAKVVKSGEFVEPEALASV
jgi:small subunit ribosomal protein S3Ae